MTTEPSAKPRRILALWLPRLPTERLKRRPGPSPAPGSTPLVLSLKAANARIVYACDANAVRVGLRPGMPLASARAIVNALDVIEADLAADAALLAQIADWCDRFTPFVALDPPHGLLLDVSGVAHLFGGEPALLARIRDDFRRQGFSAHAAIAGTAQAARALARFANGTIAPPGGEAAATAPLPVAALDLDAKDTHALERAGLKTLGQVAARTRAELNARFGKAMVFKLDRALGQAEKPISPRRILPAYRVERRFAEPVAAADFIADTLHGLAQSLFHAMTERGHGARALEASFFRTDGIVRRIAIETARPLREPEIIVRLFQTKLDALQDPLDPGFGFDLIALSALATEALEPESIGLDAKSDDGKEIAQLVDRLAARFGSHRVLVFQPQDTHIPEAAGVAVPAQHAEKMKLVWDPRTQGEPPHRPIRLFAKPQPVDGAIANVPDGPPASFKWRGVRHRVVRAEGPERIATEWWQSQTPMPTRDYFRIEDEKGQRFWLYRDGLYGRETSTPRWFMHGLFA